jgi:hypothetical protein
MLTPQDLNDLRAPVHIISLGAGVQSSTMALMAARGLILPRPIGAIFADTQDEPAGVDRAAGAGVLGGGVPRAGGGTGRGGGAGFVAVADGPGGQGGGGGAAVKGRDEG